MSIFWYDILIFRCPLHRCHWTINLLLIFSPVFWGTSCVELAVNISNKLEKTELILLNQAWSLRKMQWITESSEYSKYTQSMNHWFSYSLNHWITKISYLAIRNCCAGTAIGYGLYCHRLTLRPLIITHLQLQ